MAKIIQTLTESRIATSFQEASLKQKLTVGIGTVVVIAVISMGIFQVISAREAQIADNTNKTEVNVEGVSNNGNATTATDNTNVDAVTSTYDPKTSPTYENQTGEANAATVQVPEADSNTYDYGSDGAIYEGSDDSYVAETPAATTNTTYQAAPADAGWDGNFNAPQADSTGATGKPIFGSN